LQKSDIKIKLSSNKKLLKDKAARVKNHFGLKNATRRLRLHVLLREKARINQLAAHGNDPRAAGAAARNSLALSALYRPGGAAA
jgi:hypothetical protein